MRENILRLVNISAGYSGKVVIHGVSFSVAEKEKVVVMGPNGSGKSTLLKVIPLLIKPYSGEVLFRGVDITKLSEHELRSIRSKMGYLPQGSTLFPHMKVIDNVMLPLRLVLKLSKGEAYKRAMEYLKMLGVDSVADKYPAQLSGGQQQRVALARALAMEPELLLLDEPTASLDPQCRQEVLEVLYDITKLGKAMIVVTHEIGFAKRVADKLLIIERGRIVFEGPFDTSKLSSLYKGIDECLC